MSVIAVTGVHNDDSLADVKKLVEDKINGPFHMLNFTIDKKVKKIKICYICLSEQLDPKNVVENINNAQIKAKDNLILNAFIPQEVPKLEVKRKNITLQLQRALKLSGISLPHDGSELITNAHHELFLELQYKYPGLYNLSGKTSHKLLDEIAQIIGDRLMNLMDSTANLGASCKALTNEYRRVNLHSRDFELVLSTLHRLQDRAGAPRAHIKETELLNGPPLPEMDELREINFEREKNAATKYMDRLMAAIRDHLATPDFEEETLDIAEKLAKKNIREALEKTMPGLHEMIKQVIYDHFVPSLEEPPHRKIRIYGEPYLPSRKIIRTFIGRHIDHLESVRAIRSSRMYNMEVARVPTDACSTLLAMDGTIVGGVKLRIRADIPVHPVKESLRVKLAAHCGGMPPDPPDSEDEDEQLEQAPPLEQQASQLEQSVLQLKQGTPQLKQGTSQLKQGAPELKQGAPELKQGTAKLKQDAQPTPLVPEVPLTACSPQINAMCTAATILLRSVYASSLRR